MGKFAAQVAGFADLAKKAQELVLHDSLQDLLAEAEQVQTSKARGASGVRQGAIPVDTGFLRNTIASTINGSGQFAAVEPESETDPGGPSGIPFDVTIAGMKPGNVAHFAWTASYAMAIHSGFKTYPGAHWVTVAAAKWSQIVEENVRKHRV